MIRRGEPVEEVAELVRDREVEEVFVACDVSGFAVRRRRLADRLAGLGAPLRTGVAGPRAWCEGRTGYPIVDAGMRRPHVSQRTRCCAFRPAV